LENICQVAAGATNGALDCEGNLHFWKNSDSITKFEHGCLTDICIGSGEIGLVRDRNSNVFEWGIAR
jgi:hypothetical protein